MMVIVMLVNMTGVNNVIQGPIQPIVHILTLIVLHSKVLRSMVQGIVLVVITFMLVLILHIQIVDVLVTSVNLAVLILRVMTPTYVLVLIMICYVIMVNPGRILSQVLIVMT
tara:strand:- start:203 stop:538 length:336 start_codon:yes stop_codon:yes gene_type:complete